MFNDPRKKARNSDNQTQWRIQDSREGGAGVGAREARAQHLRPRPPIYLKD